MLPALSGKWKTLKYGNGSTKTKVRNGSEKVGSHSDSSCVGGASRLYIGKVLEACPCRGVRHGASRLTRFRNLWISKWFSGFHVDFRISKWISTFWILFEELFVILKILLINKPSQPGCTQNTMSQALHSSPRRTAYYVHN